MFNLHRKKISDEAYIEKLRLNIARSRKWGIALGCLYVAILFAAVVLFQQLIEDFWSKPKQPPYSALETGAAFGFIFGLILYTIVRHIAEAVMLTTGVHIFRWPRLLIKYHDLLRAQGIANSVEPKPPGETDTSPHP